ncbi:hypothetical protein ACQP2U_29710 [Nocardia sp. CA-084685]
MSLTTRTPIHAHGNGGIMAMTPSWSPIFQLISGAMVTQNRDGH